MVSRKHRKSWTLWKNTSAIKLVYIVNNLNLNIMTLKSVSYYEKEEYRSIAVVRKPRGGMPILARKENAIHLPDNPQIIHE
jgi:hypothetical protein